MDNTRADTLPTCAFSCTSFRRFFTKIRHDIKQCFTACFSSSKSFCLRNFGSSVPKKEFSKDLEKNTEQKASATESTREGAEENPAALDVASHGVSHTTDNVQNVIHTDDKKIVLAKCADKQGICVGCKVNTLDILILPCGHGKYCNDCLDKWCETSDKCPTCDVVIADVVQYL